MRDLPGLNKFLKVLFPIKLRIKNSSEGQGQKRWNYGRVEVQKISGKNFFNQIFTDIFIQRTYLYFI